MNWRFKYFFKADFGLMQCFFFQFFRPKRKNHILFYKNKEIKDHFKSLQSIKSL